MPAKAAAAPGVPAAAGPGGRKQGRGVDWGGIAVEGLFEALFATELGLILFGGVALAVGLPLLVIFGGAAWAAHLRRKHDAHAPRVSLGTVLTPAVLFVAFLVLVLFGAVSYTAFLTGHPAVMAGSYAAALVTLGLVGFEAWRRLADRLGQAAPPSEKLKTR